MYQKMGFRNKEHFVEWFKILIKLEIGIVIIIILADILVRNGAVSAIAG